MKKLVLVLLFLGIAFVACDKKVVYPSTISVTKIAPSALNFDGFSTVGLVATYKANVLAFNGQTNYSSDAGFVVSLSFYAKTTGGYILSNKNIAVLIYYYAHYSSHNIYYYTDSIHTGQVSLTQLDTIHHLASGTFWFNAEEQSPTVNGGIESVKNGYFTNLTW